MNDHVYKTSHYSLTLVSATALGILTFTKPKKGAEKTTPKQLLTVLILC